MGLTKGLKSILLSIVEYTLTTNPSAAIPGAQNKTQSEISPNNGLRKKNKTKRIMKEVPVAKTIGAFQLINFRYWVIAKINNNNSPAPQKKLRVK